MKMDRPYRPPAGRYGARVSILLLTAFALWTLVAAVEKLNRGSAKPGMPADLLLRAEGAAALMVQAENQIRIDKRSSGIEPDAGISAMDSALIGAELTSLVTTLGSLEAKRLAARPEWARELTLRLNGAGVRPGDFVAAGFSGSFPGLNLAVASACSALGLELAAVSSVTASTWGANQPGFTWPEIEARLVRKGLLRRVSAALSLGGEEDLALGLEPEGRKQAQSIMESVRSELGIPILASDSLARAVTARMELYDRLAAGRRISLYINVGGTEASLGRSPGILRLRSGFLPPRPWDLSPDRGIMARFVERGVPVLTLLNIQDLAARWGIQ